MTRTSIEWTDETWNPVTGCDKVSPGCDHCYAETIAHRFAGGPAFPNGFDVTLHPERLGLPLGWRKPRRVFVNSMSDLFHTNVSDEYIARVFATMARAERHTFQVLTKRPARMRSLISDGGQRLLEATTDEETAGALYGAPWPLPNVWLGVSAEDQRWADIRIPALFGTPAAVRFVSAEPLLGPIDLTSPRLLAPDVLTGRLDWVIVGGESGRGARPMHPDWARSLRDQCSAAAVPFHFKQWGEHLAVPVVEMPQMAGGRGYQDPRGGLRAAVIRETGGPYRAGAVRPLQAGDRTGAGQMLDADTFAVRVGKKKAGRELDGRTWDEFPATVGGAL